MNTFKDFKIKPVIENFTGDKIKISKILNKEIKVLKHKIENSKLNVGESCLHLQIEIGIEKYVIFTGSTILIQMIKKVPEDKFPFVTTIVKEDEHYEFT